jgi:hypothetical protein
VAELDRWTMQSLEGDPAAFTGGRGPVVLLREHEDGGGAWRYEVRGRDEQERDLDARVADLPGARRRGG